jgi:hypothetical protein
MTNDSHTKIKTIQPVLWMGPKAFKVTSTDDLCVFVRGDNRGWHACSSAQQVFDGGARVANADADLLEAAEKALALAGVPTKLLELEQEQRSVRSRAADDWRFLIERGANGTGTIGTESTGEAFIVELAGTLLPCGMPALELFHRFSWRELEEIRDAVQSMGPDGWYWPLRARRKDERSGERKGSRSSSAKARSRSAAGPRRMKKIVASK